MSTRITDLPQAETLNGSEVMPLVQNGITKHATLDFINQAAPAALILQQTQQAYANTVVLRDETEALKTEFEAQYLGSFPAPPVLNNDGSTLTVGAIYWNTSISSMCVWNGAEWTAFSSPSMMVHVQRFSGDGIQTDFLMTLGVSSASLVDVFIDGIYQNKNTFTVEDTLISFSEPPPSGSENVEVLVAVATAIGETDASLVSYKVTDDSETVRNVQSKLREWVSVKDFGAVGDGVTDDRTAIVNALTAAAGRTVVFESGKTYLIGSAIVFTGDVSICSDGADKAVIFHAGQAFTPLTIQGALSATATLTASQQINNRGWDVSSVAGVQPGMLMAVISSVSWYHDPRPESTDARKSELHRVAYISGSTVFTEDPANDGYNVPTETVTVHFYSPVSVRLENIAVRAVLPPAGVDAANVTGLRVRYSDLPVLLNVDAENTAAAGVQLIGCYRGQILGGRSSGINNYYTGYGVQIVGSSHSIVRDRVTAGSRRAVDVSGFNVISRHTLIENCVAHGGGVNSEGRIYGWTEGGVTGAYQNGFGSHGPADHTFYRGNTVLQMHTPFSVRGRNTIIENNYIVGRTRFGCVNLITGENVWIKNNIAYSGWSNLKDFTVYEGGANINTRRADWFVRFQATYQGGQIVIENNDVQIQDRFVSFEAGSVQPDITLARNKVRFATSSASDPVYFTYNDGAEVTVSRWRILDNDYIRLSGTGAVNTFYNLSLGTSTLVEGPSYSGVWVPTLTGVSNVSSVVTFGQGRFTLIDNTITFVVPVTLTATTEDKDTSFRMSLPIATSILGQSQGGLVGVATSILSGSRQTLAGFTDPTSNDFIVRGQPSVSSAVTYVLHGTYQL